jgi:hypothetical protein
VYGNHVVIGDARKQHNGVPADPQQLRRGDARVVRAEHVRATRSTPLQERGRVELLLRRTQAAHGPADQAREVLFRAP